MIKYKVTFQDTIVPVEVAGETEKMVVLKNGKRKKKKVADERFCYFDSLEEAHSAWVDKCLRAVNRAKSNVKLAERHLKTALQYEYEEQNHA
jgi:hypothetical protein